MTPQSPAGRERRRKRYAQRMEKAKTPLEILHAEYEDLRSVIRRVDPNLHDELLRPGILAIRSIRTRIQELHTKERSA